MFQLPPRTDFTQERLDRLCECLDPAFRNVIEFRHASWWNAAVYQQLAQHRISFCSISHPGLPDELVINSKTLYDRFHGVPELYKSLYPASKLKETVDQIRLSDSPEEAYIYFNNDIGASALQNAREMLEMKKG